MRVLLLALLAAGCAHAPPKRVDAHATLTPVSAAVEYPAPAPTAAPPIVELK